MEAFYKNPTATSLWTAVFIFLIAAIVLYSKWRDCRNNQKGKY